MDLIKLLGDKSKMNNEKELMKEIQVLEDKKKSLYLNIANIDRKDDFLVGNTYTYYYREIMLKRLPLNYIGTVFHLRRDMILKETNCNMDNYLLEHVISWYKQEGEESATMTIAMVCDAVLPTSNGPVLQLSDPYKIIRTFPLKNTMIEEAQLWIGKLLYVRLVLKETAVTDKVFEIKEIKQSNYTLKGEIIDNKETQLLYYGERFNEYYRCTGLPGCKAALDNIEKYLMSKKYGIYRVDNEELRFRKDDMIEILIYKNNRLEYIYCKDKPLHPMQLSKMHEQGYYRYEGDLYQLDQLYEHLY